MKKDLEIHFENWLEKKLKEGTIKKNPDYSFTYKNNTITKLGLQLIFKQEIKK